MATLKRWQMSSNGRRLASVLGCCLLGHWGMGCSASRGQEPRAPASPLVSDPSAGTPVIEGGATHAEAVLKPAPGVDLGGRATFTEEPDAVLVVLEVKGAPTGRKGVHVHEKGDCSDIQGMSMGSHFSPQSKEHALPTEQSERHLGDLGNIEVHDDGRGRLEIRLERASLQPNNPESLLGRAIVVHSGEDSGRGQQPSGGSGAPLACGVIRAG
jgi:Cu-Zn family superoxide dismutase